MREILPGVWTWSVPNEEKRIDFNGHLVVNDDGCVLIDPPAMSAEDLAQAADLGPPTSIIVTNRHHTRDAMTPAGAFKARILAHDLDAKGLPPTVRLGGVFRDADRLEGGLLVVTLMDQKSPGESALVLRIADAVILGDALIGKPAGSLSLLPAEKYLDPARARHGIRRLLDFPFEAVLVGDGRSIPRGGRAAIESFLARD